MHQIPKQNVLAVACRAARTPLPGQTLALLAAAAIAYCFPLAAQAMPVNVTCEADYGGQLAGVQLLPTDDVFEFSIVSVGERFRFQAQWLAQRAKLKTLVYDISDRSTVLLHAAEYPLPVDACPARSGLLGRNKVYSSSLERELFFQCQLNCE